MRVIHFSTFDTEGGAGGAAFQLHKSFIAEGIDSLMLVKFKKSNDKTVISISSPIFNNKILQYLKRNPLTYFIFFKISSLLKKFGKNNFFLKFNSNTSSTLFHQIEKNIQGADIICLHWIDGFLSTDLLKKIYKKTNAPIVWVLQDIEPLTGGCHYTNGCQGFTQSCGNCQQLESSEENDLSRIVWQQKKADLSGLNITLISPSSWVQEKIKESSLFKHSRIENIFLSIDDNIFKTEDSIQIRKRLNLPTKCHLIFFGAQSFSDKRKGMDYLTKSIEILKDVIIEKDPTLLESIIFLSAGRENIDLNKHFKHRHLGWIDTPLAMSEIFKAADIFACPSIEDAGPVMINQAIACGTPVVAFHVGVAQDLITSSSRGRLITNYNAKEFAEGLYDIISKNKPAIKFKNDNYECRPNIITKKYLDLFKKLLSENKH